MSECISRHGEYSSHVVDPDYVCTHCGVLDEGALIAELNRLRDGLIAAQNEGEQQAAEVERLKANQPDERARIVAALRNYPFTAYWFVADRLERGDFELGPTPPPENRPAAEVSG